MKDLNLLAYKRKGKISFYQFSGVSKPASFIVALLFFITSLIFVFVIIYNQSTIDSLKKEEAALQKDISSLSEVESKYHFIKDRASKLDSIIKSRTTLKRFDDLRSALDLVGFNSLGEAEIFNNKFSFAITTDNYQKLLDLMSLIRKNLSYKDIYLESFDFSPNKGYTVDVSLEI